MTKSIETFFVEDSQGKCTDKNWEFGNLHRQNFNCAFFRDGECHFNGDCERLDRQEATE